MKVFCRFVHYHLLYDAIGEHSRIATRALSPFYHLSLHATYNVPSLGKCTDNPVDGNSKIREHSMALGIICISFALTKPQKCFLVHPGRLVWSIVLNNKVT